MKTAITILTLTLLILSCKDNRNTAATNDTQNIQQNTQDSLTNKENKKTRPLFDIFYENESLKLYGDTTIEKHKIYNVLLKFEPYISFDDFKVTKIDHKKYAKLDLKSSKGANNFRTVLRSAFSQDHANFAGHYSFVYWGCGTTCQSSSIIDRKTGKVYDSPGASLGYDFRVDSRLLIANPPDSTGFYNDDAYSKPSIYIFDEQTKTFTERQPTLE
jgi:hypothetical protein